MPTTRLFNAICKALSSRPTSRVTDETLQRSFNSIDSTLSDVAAEVEDQDCEHGANDAISDVLVEVCNLRDQVQDLSALKDEYIQRVDMLERILDRVVDLAYARKPVLNDHVSSTEFMVTTNEKIKWCTDHLNDWEYIVIDDHSRLILISIYNEEDAVAYRLKWGDDTP